MIILNQIHHYNLYCRGYLLSSRERSRVTNYLTLPTISIRWSSTRDLKTGKAVIEAAKAANRAATNIINPILKRQFIKVQTFRKIINKQKLQKNIRIKKILFDNNIQKLDPLLYRNKNDMYLTKYKYSKNLYIKYRLYLDRNIYLTPFYTKDDEFLETKMRLYHLNGDFVRLPKHSIFNKEEEPIYLEPNSVIPHIFQLDYYKEIIEERPSKEEIKLAKDSYDETLLYYIREEARQLQESETQKSGFQEEWGKIWKEQWQKLFEQSMATTIKKQREEEKREEIKKIYNKYSKIISDYVKKSSKKTLEDNKKLQKELRRELKRIQKKELQEDLEEAMSSMYDDDYEETKESEEETPWSQKMIKQWFQEMIKRLDKDHKKMLKNRKEQKETDISEVFKSLDSNSKETKKLLKTFRKRK